MLMLVVKRLLGAVLFVVSVIVFAGFAGMTLGAIFGALWSFVLFLAELALLIMWSGAILWLLFSERE